MKQKRTTCLRCDAEMVEGHLLDLDFGDIATVDWVEDRPTKRTRPRRGKKAPGKRRTRIQAYRCPKCSHVELFADASGRSSNGTSRQSTGYQRQPSSSRGGSRSGSRASLRSTGSGRLLLYARRLRRKSEVYSSKLVSLLVSMLRRMRMFYWRLWKNGRNRLKALRRQPMAMLDRNCRWCKDEELKPAHPEWLDYPLLIIGVRPYYCPHCFNHFYRFKQ